MLRIDDLVVRYGSVTAVQGISLTVDEGEVVALVGPNGAGKSTTLNAVTGVVRPASGDIRFEGESIVGEVPEALVRRGIAMVPEGRHIFGSLTVAENLQLGATVRDDHDAIDADLKHVFELFPVLERYYETQADRLSGGEQQQLAIARALLSKPRLLLLDEPSLGLAPLMIDLVFEVMERLKADGSTILLVEQAAARAVDFADRSYVLRTGRIALSGTREDLADKADLAEAYLWTTQEAPGS
jgi:branched-chain amino acid transport system ATP-binding protein